MSANTKCLQTESKPFIKWAGGKRALLDSIVSFIPKDFKNYFEPFVGGGAIFFALQNRGILESKQVFINDKNTELMNAYVVVQENPKELVLILQIMQSLHCKDFFYLMRNLDRERYFKENVQSYIFLDSTQESMNIFEEIIEYLKAYTSYFKDCFTQLQSLNSNKAFGVFKAARFLYLNKTCFNGLCRYNAKGEFNTPMGSYKNPKICDNDLIFESSKSLKNVDLFCGDFTEITQKAQNGDFIYFDPPYFPLNETSSFVSYTDVFLQNEQEKLCEVFKDLDSKGMKVLQSNSNTPFIRELYKDFELIEIQARRAINCKGDKRGKIIELLIRGNYE